MSQQRLSHCADTRLGKYRDGRAEEVEANIYCCRRTSGAGQGILTPELHPMHPICTCLHCRCYFGVGCVETGSPSSPRRFSRSRGFSRVRRMGLSWDVKGAMISQNFSRTWTDAVSGSHVEDR